MSMRTALIAVSPLLACIPPLVPPAHPSLVRCHDVVGSMEARVDRVRPSFSGLRFDGTGASRGGLEGVVAIRAYKRPGAQDLRLRVLITTEAGVVEVSGNASAVPAPAAPDMRALHGTWKIAGQSGAALASTGAMTGTGVVDTRARSAAIEYSGRICEENAAGDTNPRVARRAVGKWVAVAA
jgi:hypothetical protein